jgi:hypothetical protein
MTHYTEAMTNAAELHANGIHTKCTYPKRKTGGASGGRTPIMPKYQDGNRADWCVRAGKIDRFHSHDFDGPLWDACGCDD